MSLGLPLTPEHPTPLATSILAFSAPADGSPGALTHSLLIFLSSLPSILHSTSPPILVFSKLGFDPAIPLLKDLPWLSVAHWVADMDSSHPFKNHQPHGVFLDPN